MTMRMPTTFVALLGALVLAASASASPGVDARQAPIRTVRVSWGSIGYRSIGHGRPLVMLIGGGGPAVSIDGWPPALLDLLAQGRRVIAMDYEGIGRTTLRPGTLTITRLADDTADFIRALRLRRPDVLGWSMGGFVAQSLAVRYPQLVRRLVLCSTAPGNDTATTPKVSGKQAYPAQWLFPFNSLNRARAIAYERAVHSYPHYYEGPAKVAQAQAIANFLWAHGDVPEGHDVNRLGAPSLVGGGTQDVIAPMPDSVRLARALPHARLKLYHDAGHGFLVQHIADWARRVTQFLG